MEATLIAPPKSDTFLKRVNNRAGFNFFLWFKLPAAFWSGVRLRSMDLERCVVSVPYKRFSQNPFRSTYFACLVMAAEMSTGVPAMMAIEGASPSVSMLVTGLEAVFVKKATSRTYFTFEDIQDMLGVVERTKSSDAPITYTATSVGRDSEGNEIARFNVTWSFKARRKK